MTIHMYDFEFNRLASENRIIQARWTVYYNGIGSFEAHFPITSDLVKLVSENKYMVAVCEGFFAVIVGYELLDELVLYGRSCNWLLSKRIVPSAEGVTARPGEYVSELAEKAFSDTDNFTVGEIAQTSETEISHSVGTLSEVAADILKLSGLGHELIFDVKNKQWKFNIIKGTENKLILSEGHKNAYDTKGSFDILELATCGIYKDGEDGDLKEISREDKTGIYRWQAYITEDSEAEALARMEELREKNEITAKLRGLRIGIDYGLGDTVRIQIIKGEYRDTRSVKIKGAEFRAEQGVYTQQPIFE